MTSAALRALAMALLVLVSGGRSIAMAARPPQPKELPGDPTVPGDPYAEREWYDSLASGLEAPRGDGTIDDAAAVYLDAALGCETTLHDPVRALRLYNGVLQAAPDSPQAHRARARIAALVAQGAVVAVQDEEADVRDPGPDAAHDGEARDLAEVVRRADELAVAEVVRRVERLTYIQWPGAAEAALWLAEWHRRHGRYAAAITAYETVMRRFDRTAEARSAKRAAVTCALDARRWDEAAERAMALDVEDEGDRILRDDVLARAVIGRLRATRVRWCWLVFAVVIAALGASLVEASLRGGRRRPVLRPGAELWFVVPVAAVLYGLALTTNALIAPAVLVVSVGGIALSWLSGAGLDTLRSAGREVRVRAIAHALLGVAGVASLLYVALMRHQLLDLVIETAKFGPGQ